MRIILSISSFILIVSASSRVVLHRLQFKKYLFHINPIMAIYSVPHFILGLFLLLIIFRKGELENVFTYWQRLRKSWHSNVPLSTFKQIFISGCILRPFLFSCYHWNITLPHLKLYSMNAQHSKTVLRKQGKAEVVLFKCATGGSYAWLTAGGGRQTSKTIFKTTLIWFVCGSLKAHFGW